MLDLGVKNDAKMIERKSKNGSQRGFAIMKHTKKRHGTIMPKVDAVQKKTNVDDPRSVIWAGWGRGGDFMQYLLTSSVIQHAMHHLRQGAADFWDPFSDMGPPRVDFYDLFARFDAMRKKHVFPIDDRQ